MSQTIATQHLESLIRTLFEEGRCGEYYLVDMTVSPTGLIAVYVDGDEGVSLDACTQISRILESVLDAEPALGGIYTLEVSSPGVSRPLRFLRQYIKHVGRTLKVILEDEKVMEGMLTATGHDSITIEIKPKDRKSQPEVVEIPFEKIREAYVTIQFGKNKKK